MPSVARLSIFLLSSLCAFPPSQALIAPKPLFDSLRPRTATVIRMTETKMLADLVLPNEIPAYVQDRKGVISTVITASYMSIIVSIMALPVTLSAMSADVAFYGAKTKGSFLAEVVFAATIAIMVGKFVLGPVTDMMGGDTTLQITMGVMAALLYACAVSSSIQAFGLYWIIINFAYASAWGAEWPKILGLVAAGSRLGSMWSALLYGSILRTGISSAGLLGAMGLGAAQGSWRAIYKVSAVMQGGALLAYVLCDKLLLSDSPSFIQRQSARLKQQLNSKGQGQGQGQGQSIGGANQVTVDSAAAAAAATVGVPVPVPESLSQVLRRISTDRRFWLMLAGKVALMTVGQFISFIPLYLRTGHNMPDGEAAAKSAVFAMGSLVSSVFGSRVYQSLSGPMQVRAITICNWFGFTLPALLVAHHYSGPLTAVTAFLLSENMVMIILGLWGGAWAVPFYLPAGVLALSLGGITHAALLTNLFDAVGFLAASVLSYYAMELGRKNMWFPLLLSLCGAGGIALMTMSKSMALSLSLATSNTPSSSSSAPNGKTDDINSKSKAD